PSLLPTLVLTSTSRGETVASLTGPTVALLNSRYNNASHNQHYGTKDFSSRAKDLLDGFRKW
ncbi:hypothetical protein, partial [Rhizobium aethiopicum]|uniref:hypothetical protein n=1 Tax=Rhizobium aethiopicum TaxID=1138170 RepID=UPI001AEDE8C5